MTPRDGPLPRSSRSRRSSAVRTNKRRHTRNPSGDPAGRRAAPRRPGPAPRPLGLRGRRGALVLGGALAHRSGPCPGSATTTPIAASSRPRPPTPTPPPSRSAGPHPRRLGVLGTPHDLARRRRWPRWGSSRSPAASPPRSSPSPTSPAGVDREAAALVTLAALARPRSAERGCDLPADAAYDRPCTTDGDCGGGYVCPTATSRCASAASVALPAEGEGEGQPRRGRGRGRGPTRQGEGEGEGQPAGGEGEGEGQPPADAGPTGCGGPADCDDDQFCTGVETVTSALRGRQPPCAADHLRRGRRHVQAQCLPGEPSATTRCSVTAPTCAPTVCAPTPARRAPPA